MTGATEHKIGDFLIRTSQRYLLSVDFSVWRTTGEASTGEPLYGDDCDMSSEATERNRFLHGHVKWDGCLEVNYTDTHQHFCLPQHVDQLRDLLAGLWEIARPILGEKADF